MYKEIQLQLHLFILWSVPALGTIWCWTHKWGQWNWPTRGNIKYILIPSYVQNSHAEEEKTWCHHIHTNCIYIWTVLIFTAYNYIYSWKQNIQMLNQRLASVPNIGLLSMFTHTLIQIYIKYRYTYKWKYRYKYK